MEIDHTGIIKLSDWFETEKTSALHPRCIYAVFVPAEHVKQQGVLDVPSGVRHRGFYGAKADVTVTG
eukprot:144656-Rhodomonas_salina.1